MTTVKVFIEDGIRKAELEMQADKTQKIAIIGGIFGIFGVNQEVRDMLETYQKAGQAYKGFFDKVKPIELPNNQKPLEVDQRESVALMKKLEEKRKLSYKKQLELSAMVKRQRPLTKL
ncbi:hypothetical protein [Paenibacillus senegalensis]|uniref:hypothetical protein n=1 Tax=Paenibacillus senegalensis TaxID=1465766 RepID=UPI0002882460|nr:hypothetical protein [Paenibacillus senegalensis]